MHLVLKVGKVISRTNWRALSLCDVLWWLILFSGHVSFITIIYPVPEVLSLVKKGLVLHIFTDSINPYETGSVVLVSAGMNLIFFQVAGTELCLGFSVRMLMLAFLTK